MYRMTYGCRREPTAADLVFRGPHPPDHDCASGSIWVGRDSTRPLDSALVLLISPLTRNVQEVESVTAAEAWQGINSFRDDDIEKTAIARCHAMTIIRHEDTGDETNPPNEVAYIQCSKQVHLLRRRNSPLTKQGYHAARKHPNAHPTQSPQLNPA